MEQRGKRAKRERERERERERKVAGLKISACG
jgi:hypothetical protein